MNMSFIHMIRQNGHAASLIQSHSLLEWTYHIINSITQFVKINMTHHQFNHTIC
jgi:hypothetical protein